MSWKLYDIVLQYKEIFFETYIRYDLFCKDILYYFSAQRKILIETYTRYNLYFKDIWHSYSVQRNLFLKHIPHIAYTLKIYDIIVQNKEKFIWNIYQI